MADTGWALRVMWPIEDPGLFDAEAIASAQADLPNVAVEVGAVMVGQPTFKVVDCAGLGWPTTPTAVVCVVPARPILTCAAEPTESRRAA